MSEQLNYNINVNTNAGESLGSLKKQLREAQQEVAALSDKFGATSKQAIEAAKRAAELKDRIGDAKALTDAFNPDAKFKALTASLSGVAGGFAAVQGAIGLFGAESEVLEKQLLKVQSALALSQGLQSVGESIDSFKQLGAVIQSTTIFQKANAAANALTATTLKAIGVAAETSAIGFRVLKAAIVSTGIGILVVALGELVSALMNYTSAADKAKKKQEELNEVLANGEKEALKASKKFIKAQSDLNQLRAKSEGATEEQIDAIRVDGIKKQITANKNKYETLLKLDKKAASELVEENADLQDELTKIELEGKIRRNEKNKQIASTNAARNKQQAQKEKQEREQEEKDEIARQQAQADRESAAQKIQIAAYRSTLDKRNQDLLAAEDEFENKKGDLIRAGIYDFTLLEEEYRLKLLEINKNYNNQEEEEYKRQEDKKKALEETNRQREFETRQLQADTLAEKVQLELEALENEYNAKLLLAIANGENILLLEENYAAKKLAITQKLADEEKAVDKSLKDAKEQALLSGLNLLSSVAGENERVSNIIFGIQKALEIGKIISSTASAISQVSAGVASVPAVLPPGVPNPAFPPAVAIGAKKIAGLKIGAAAQIGSIAAATLSKFKGSGGGGIGGSAPSGAAAPITPQRQEPQTTNISQQSINALGNQAIRAYVVETDVTSNQKRVQAIKQRARFS